jgi:hypothetical protein
MTGMRKDSSPNKVRSKLRTGGILVILSLFLLTTLTNPVAAQESGTGSNMDFFCEKTDKYGNVVEPGEPGYEQASYDTIVYLLQNVIGVFMVVGPIAGIVVGLYATVASVLIPGGDDGSNYTKTRRNSLLFGFGIPIFALMLKALSGAYLPYNVGCIVPPLPI